MIIGDKMIINFEALSQNIYKLKKLMWNTPNSHTLLSEYYVNASGTARHRQVFFAYTEDENILA